MVKDQHDRRESAAFAWGYNNAGGLGIGNVARALRPVPVRLPEATADVQGGTDFTIALTSGGQVFSWGGNRFGQLGDGTTTSRLRPQRIEFPGDAHVTAISVGTDHVLALTRRGAVLGWGRNAYGQLGDGSRTDRSRPIATAAHRVSTLATGTGVSAAITAAGALLTWGRAASGQLGLASLGGLSVSTMPAAVSLPRGAKAVMVVAGQRHMVVLTGDGRLLTFGVDPGGNPLPSSVPTDPTWGTVTSISAGDNHTVALTDTGAVCTWGANYHGQLGTGDTTNRATPVAVRTAKLCGRVTAVAAGGDSVLACTSDDQVYAWGYGKFGQNGDGRTADQTRPQPVRFPDQTRLAGIHAGRYHSLATTCPA